MLHERENFLTTATLAERLGVSPNTVRRGLCVKGEYMGLRPVKLPNGRLLWPEKPLDEILGGK